MTIIVGGYIGLYATGGASWDYLQYPVGLHMLGHEVYYLEDTMQYPVFQKNESDCNTASCIAHLKSTMELVGLKDRWIYRDVITNTIFGMSETKFKEICATADIFINVSASVFMRDEYYRIPVKILIDSDPMFTQVQDWDDMEPEASYLKMRERYGIYDHLFSFGENIGNPGCRIPTLNLLWKVTRQPICIDQWPYNFNQCGKAFTTIMNWSERAKMNFGNEQWGQKDIEFEKIREMPSLFTKKEFHVVVADNSKKLIAADLESMGWKTFDPTEKIKSVSDYKNYIEGSFGEFSVAKETYVKSNSGWFSGRSACYLASGKPVVTQETMWSKYIPSGEGLIAFTDMPGAIEALEKIVSDPVKHSKRSREIAVEYFDSNKVLSKMLEAIN